MKKLSASISIAAWVKIPENPTGMGAIVSKRYDFSGAQRRSFALVILSDGSARFDIDASGARETGSYWSGEPDSAIVDVAPGNALLISKNKVASVRTFRRSCDT